MRQFVGLLCVASMLEGAELPVKKVILYKHGIGYFERSGEIPAGESARLDFKADEMNDVLKSLTVQDKTGNSVSGVRYDSSLPLNAKLAEFPFKLGERSPLTDFLDQLKGARIELKLGQGTVAGQIVGARLMAGRERAQTSTEMISVLTAGGDIVSHDLGAVSSMRLSDPELQLQLSEYLRSLNASRSREQKSVYVDSSKDAARKLSVAYTIPMPVWKSSYRLVLDAGAAKKPLLEGWAIIDNTTSEDWTRVDLSVISGRPVSFISKLYEPRFVQREVAELAEERSLAPKVYGSGVGSGKAGGVGAGTGGGLYAGSLSAPPPGRRESEADRFKMAPMAGYAESPAMATMESSVSVNTATREAGELFEYRFGQPVTVKRNESAMLPFVQQEIAARKLLIYTEDSSNPNPLNSAELTNTTGKTLDGGPLSVSDSGVYAGEALMNTFKPGDKRLLSYASDLGTRVIEDANEAPIVLRTVKATGGMTTSNLSVEVTKTYKISNVDRKLKNLMIEHAIRYDNKLTSLKPSEQTATHYRFEVKLTGEAEQSFVVKEERTISQQQHLSNTSEEQIALWVASNRLSAEAKQVLNAIAGLRRQIAESNNTIKTLNQQVTEATADQERVRRNLSSLNSVSGQQERVQKYASDLANLDGRVVSLRDQIAAETRKRDGLNQQLSQRIDSASF
ncbi:MAG: hypothetical protein FJW36_10930 [Acidobacteria bacterium]|nr:hypothetical protein [Acidobacteriota bacterium]